MLIVIFNILANSSGRKQNGEDKQCQTNNTHSQRTFNGALQFLANDSFVKAVSSLSDQERQQDRGAFFGSI